VAYPFKKHPNRQEFIQISEKHGWNLSKTKSSVNGPRGPVVFEVLEKKDQSGKIIAVVALPELSDDECLVPSVVENLCRRLSIPVKEFYGEQDNVVELSAFTAQMPSKDC